MKKFKLILWLVLLLQQEWAVSFARAASTVVQSSSIAQSTNDNLNKDASASSALGTAMYRKSRQSRCVRCYEDRDRYGGEDRSRSSSSNYGGYSSRAADDRSSNWYYPSYDRIEDRYRGSTDRDYNRDDRYSARTYDRYDDRRGTYDDRRTSYDDRRTSYDDRRGSYDDRRGSYDRGSESRGYSGYDGGRGGYDRYDDRRGSYYDRGDSQYRDRYYSDYYRDRNYDRTRQGVAGAAQSGYGYDRDYYDRYYSRYDFRNYRPWDETYRGQSGFDNSGRGYYFAGDDNRRPYLPQDGQQTSQQQPCGMQISNCPYGSTNPTKVTSRPIDSQSQNGVSNSANGVNQSSAPNSNSGSGANKSSWSYMKEQDKDTRGGGNRDRDRDQQSSSYGGRARPVGGGSYLFDRENNEISDGQTNANGAAESNKASSDQNAKSTGSSQDRTENGAAAQSPAGDKQ